MSSASLDALRPEGFASNARYTPLSLPLDTGYNPGYTGPMKTAISVPEPIYVAAERLAHQLGISRSELYATAVSDFIRTHQGDQITAQLNRVYATEDSALDPVLVQIQALSLPREE